MKCGHGRFRSNDGSPGTRALDRITRRGFTLIELLVVILIILLVSAVALPTVIPAITHRQVSEAARILQAALVGARDVAINTGAPAGIRLLPDPVYVPQVTQTLDGQQGLMIDPSKILAANRFIPIQLAPDYSEGFVNLDSPNSGPPAFTATFPYPGTPSGQVYPTTTKAMLYLEQAVYTNGGATSPPVINTPTSWYWNVRIGDKIQINNSGIYYTVVGPMTIPNVDLFVNVGPPGTTPPLGYTATPTGVSVPPYSPEFLFLVNGQDDNHDGFIDNGFDGIDNDGDGNIDQVLVGGLSEWVETETWKSTFASPAGNYVGTNLPYSITRRPVPAPGSRETPLPSNVVIDLTTWNPQFFTAQAIAAGITNISYVSERSRLPVDPNTGYVDILLNPNGTVVPTTEYSSPTSAGMGSAFYHFWLSERSDLFDPQMQAPAGVPYLLPMVSDLNNSYPNPNDNFKPRALSGERRLVTLFARTGQIVTNQIETFNGTAPSLPFLGAQQGTRGDSR